MILLVKSRNLLNFERVCTQYNLNLLIYHNYKYFVENVVS